MLVPQVVGLSTPDAIDAANEAGLEWTVFCNHDESQAEGIIDQEPPAGAGVAPGSPSASTPRASPTASEHPILRPSQGISRGSRMSMRLRATTGPPATIEADVLAVPIYREDAEMASDLAELDAASDGAISRAIAWGEYNPLEHPLRSSRAGT